MPKWISNGLPIAVLLASSPWVAESFGWLKLDTLSESLMGVRPEWVIASNCKNIHNSNCPQSSQQRYSTQSSRLRSSQQHQHSTTKEDQANMVDFMNEQPNLLDASELDPFAPLDVDTLDLLNCIVRAADGRKADDIRALKVHHVTTLTSVLVILSGNSRPQNQAIAAAITKDVFEKFGQRPGGGPNGIPEGSAESGWMLLDYGTVMVHIMTPKSRLFYNVQGQWMQKGAREIDLSHLLIPNTVQQPPPPPSPLSFSPPAFQPDATWQVDTTSESLAEKDEEDPFWS
ncbi:hypothetical protein ACA910_019828 [Epithemia clementina (nom. ined.)]